MRKLVNAKDANRNRHTKKFTTNPLSKKKVQDNVDVGVLSKYQDDGDKQEREHPRYGHHHHDYPKYEGMNHDNQSGERRLQSLPTPTVTGDSCPEERKVVCVDGEAVSVGGDSFAGSCAEACGNTVSGGVATGGECCGGYSSCDGFTGTVCKDNVSCSDVPFGFACQGANIGTVFLSCYGDSACSGAGTDGYIGSITNSSCIGESACSGAGTEGGSIGYITDSSCRGDFSCFLAAGCIFPVACVDSPGGNITFISSSCQGDSSCRKVAASYTTTFFDVVSGCTIVGDDFPGNFVNGIYSSCNAEKACQEAAFGNGAEYAIGSGFSNCCNTAEECVNVKEATLPAECGALESPSNPPSSSGVPSFSPSGSPSLSRVPSKIPSKSPSISVKPSNQPSDEPSISSSPSPVPSDAPSTLPTVSLLLLLSLV